MQNKLFLIYFRHYIKWLLHHFCWLSARFARIYSAISFLLLLIAFAAVNFQHLLLCTSSKSQGNWSTARWLRPSFSELAQSTLKKTWAKKFAIKFHEKNFVGCAKEGKKREQNLQSPNRSRIYCFALPRRIERDASDKKINIFYSAWKAFHTKNWSWCW